MKFAPYPQYKPSGVEWLGEVPEHWKVKRLKTSATCWVSNVDKIPAEDELPVRLCNYTDVYYHDHITPEMELMETTATADEIRRFGLREGDVVITKDSEEWNDIAVPALVKKSAPDLVCGYHLAIVRARRNVLDPDYLLRAFQSCAINQQFQVAASGVTRYGLPKASIGDSQIPLPDLTEQRAIAAFLDRETGRLDNLIAKKRQLIEKLKEKRTALISRTVTRGLNPNAKLKPSGIEWLADIPAHWNAKRFGYLFRFYSGGTPSTAENSLWDGDIPWVSSKDMKSTVINDTQDHISEEAVRVSATCKLPSGTLLMVNRSGILRHSLPVAVTTREMAINQDIRGCVPLGSVNATFVAYLLQGNEGPLLTLWRQQGATVESLNFESVKLTRILLPPAPEQAAIVEFLDAETAKIDRLVEKVKAAIEKLLEYRTALITAAVTGKIDVRNAS